VGVCYLRFFYDLIIAFVRARGWQAGLRRYQVDQFGVDFLPAIRIDQVFNDCYFGPFTV